MFDNLSVLAYGIVTFAIVIGVGAVVLSKFGTSVAECPAGFSYNTNGSVTYTTGYCYNNTSPGSTGTNITTAGPASEATRYLNTELGSSGLAGWAPAIIALVVGLIFLAAFMTKKGKKY